MENKLQNIHIKNFTTLSGKVFDIPLSFQVFGCQLHTAPIVMVNHALSGNSEVSGDKGWWNTLIGDGKVIDTQKFSVISFNIPGNGFDGFFIENYQDFTIYDVAKIFILGLESLKINRLKMLIGGSIGGAIAWEMLVQCPDLADIFVPVATDFKTTDWLYSQCLVQKFLLESEDEPLQKARIHAMLCYRTPDSLNLRFKNEIDKEKIIRKSEDWLKYHGRALYNRFDIKAYRLMNHLLMNIGADERKLEKILAEIHLISVDLDLFFPAFEIKNCYQKLKKNKENVFYHEIKSIHGHDAFLMEYEQLESILRKIIE